MDQWITALERVAKSCHWTGKNRFESFAPIRLNVAAQWLVDGVSSVENESYKFLITISERLYVELVKGDSTGS